VHLAAGAVAVVLGVGVGAGDLGVIPFVADAGFDDLLIKPISLKAVESALAAFMPA